MPPAAQTLVDLRERLQPAFIERRTLPDKPINAMGELAVASELHENTEQQACAGEVRAFVGDYIPQNLIDKDPANESLLELAATMVAKNWLQNGNETAEDSQLLASILLPIFNAVPAQKRIDAVNKFSKLRTQFRAGWRDEDTTRGIMTMLNVDTRPTKSTRFIQRNLTPEQYQQLLVIRNRHGTDRQELADTAYRPRPAAEVVAEWDPVQNRHVFVRRLAQ